MLTIFVPPYQQGRNEKKQANAKATDQQRAADAHGAGRANRTGNPERDETLRDPPESSPHSAGDDPSNKKKNPRDGWSD